MQRGIPSYEKKNPDKVFSVVWIFFPSKIKANPLLLHLCKQSRHKSILRLASLDGTSIKVKQGRRNPKGIKNCTPPFPKSSSYLSSHHLQQTLWQAFYTRCFSHNTLSKMNSFLALSKEKRETASSKDILQWPVHCLCQKDCLRLWKSWRWPWSQTCSHEKYWT